MSSLASPKISDRATRTHRTFSIYYMPHQQVKKLTCSFSFIFSKFLPLLPAIFPHCVLAHWMIGLLERRPAQTVVRRQANTPFHGDTAMTEDLTIITVDNRLRPAEAARLVDVCPDTIVRWTRCGGKGVRLEHARMGRRLYTSKSALDRFMNRLASVNT